MTIKKTYELIFDVKWNRPNQCIRTGSKYASLSESIGVSECTSIKTEGGNGKKIEACDNQKLNKPYSHKCRSTKYLLMSPEACLYAQV